MKAKKRATSEGLVVAAEQAAFVNEAFKRFRSVCIDHGVNFATCDGAQGIERLGERLNNAAAATKQLADEALAREGRAFTAEQEPAVIRRRVARDLPDRARVKELRELTRDDFEIER
jgi:hypothetical protein